MAKEMHPHKIIPTTIIAGFLGAGKTTLLNRMLNDDHGLKFAVMVNDFGAINIDSQLIVSLEDDVLSLKNGCICCTVQNDLIEQLEKLLSRQKDNAPDYIIIEASGVSDPEKIAHTLRSPQFNNRANVDAIITLLDCANVNHMADDVKDVAVSQLHGADIILLSKCDLVSEGEIKKIKETWIPPNSRVIESQFGDVALKLLLGINQFNPDNLLTKTQTHNHGDQFSTWHWQSGGLLNLGRLRAAFESLPANIYRAKGIFNIEELPTHQCIVQMVGKRIEFSQGPEWGETSTSNQVVIIAYGDNIAIKELEAIFSKTKA